MKVRIYSHNGKIEFIEFDLGEYTMENLDKVKSDYFTACGKNCYLKVGFFPENEKEERMISYFSWQMPNSYTRHFYTVQARYAMQGNKILPRVSDETLKELDEFLTSDRKEYERWMSAN